MKDVFTQPEVTVIRFSAADIIVSSKPTCIVVSGQDENNDTEQTPAG